MLLLDVFESKFSLNRQAAFSLFTLAWVSNTNLCKRRQKYPSSTKLSNEKKTAALTYVTASFTSVNKAHFVWCFVFPSPKGRNFHFSLLVCATLIILDDEPKYCSSLWLYHVCDGCSGYYCNSYILCRFLCNVSLLAVKRITPWGQ